MQACLDVKLHKETRASQHRDYHLLSITARLVNLNGKASHAQRGTEQFNQRGNTDAVIPMRLSPALTHGFEIYIEGTHTEMTRHYSC